VEANQCALSVQKTTGVTTSKHMLVMMVCMLLRHGDSANICLKLTTQLFTQLMNILYLTLNVIVVITACLEIVTAKNAQWATTAQQLTTCLSCASQVLIKI